MYDGESVQLHACGQTSSGLIFHQLCFFREHLWSFRTNYRCIRINFCSLIWYGTARVLLTLRDLCLLLNLLINLNVSDCYVTPLRWLLYTHVIPLLRF